MLSEYVIINLKYKSQENYRRIIKNHINPVLGKFKLKSITPAVLQKFFNDKHKSGLARKTLTIIHTVLNSSFKQAVYPYKLINENPMQIYVKLPKKEGRKSTEADLKILDLGTVKKISEYLDVIDSFYMPFHIGFNTGMRVSEVCSLQWDDIDLFNGTITVDKIMVCVEKEWVFGTPKTAASYRTISIGETLIKILKNHQKRQKENRLRYGEHYHISNFVCTKENGHPVTPSSCKTSGRRIREKLDIDFNFHSLRHTHATILLEKKVPIKDIQKRLGHSRIGITLDTYSHLTDKMKNETVDIFESILDEVK